MLQGVFKHSRNSTCNKMFTDYQIRAKGKKIILNGVMNDKHSVSVMFGGNRIKINEKIKERMPLKKEGHGREVRTGSCEKEMK